MNKHQNFLQHELQLSLQQIQQVSKQLTKQSNFVQKDFQQPLLYL